MALFKTVQHIAKHHPGVYVIPLIAVFVFIAGVAMSVAHKPFASAEVAFTDASPSGLAIVPASCPSSPDTGSCGCGPVPSASYGCLSFESSRGNEFCYMWGYRYSCPSGYSFDGNWCVVTGSACDAITPPGTCSVGYTQNSIGQCVFTQCPSGYTQATDSNGNPACIQTTDTSCAPALLCNGADGNLYQRYSDCSISATPAQPLCQYGCTGDTCNPTPVPKIVTFSLAPSLVVSGKTTVISWNVVNVANCTVTGSNIPPDLWSQPTGATTWAGSGTSASITRQTVFTLHCSIIPGAVNPDGSPAVWTDQSATVNIVPTFHEQ